MSSASDFKQLPSISAVEKRVRELHQALNELAQAIGNEVAQMQETIKQNTAITDQVLQELSLQMTFIMQTIRVTKPLHGGLADANGKVPVEVKTASQIYQETGRAKLLEQIEAARHAQGLPTAENAPASNGAASDGSAADAQDAALAPAGPKLITH